MLFRNKANEKQKEDILTFVEEKFERRLTEVKSDLETKIAGVRTEVAQSKVEIIKWMFTFWVGQIGVLATLLFTFFK